MRKLIVFPNLRAQKSILSVLCKPKKMLILLCLALLATPHLINCETQQSSSLFTENQLLFDQKGFSPVEANLKTCQSSIVEQLKQHQSLSQGHDLHDKKEEMLKMPQIELSQENDRLYNSLEKEALPESTIVDVQVTQQGKLVVQNIEISRSIEELVRLSPLVLKDELPHIIFTSSMHTQVLIVDNMQWGNREVANSIDKTLIYENTAPSECPPEDKFFENQFEFQAASDNTIITKVDYQLQAIDRVTGTILFNISMTEFTPHFNVQSEANLLNYVEFVQSFKNTAALVPVDPSSRLHNSAQTQQQEEILVQNDDVKNLQEHQIYPDVENTLNLAFDDKSWLGKLRSGLYFDLEMLGLSNIDSTQTICSTLIFLLLIILYQQLCIMNLRNKQGQACPTQEIIYQSQTPVIRPRQSDFLCFDQHAVKRLNTSFELKDGLVNPLFETNSSYESSDSSSNCGGDKSAKTKFKQNKNKPSSIFLKQLPINKKFLEKVSTKQSLCKDNSDAKLDETDNLRTALVLYKNQKADSRKLHDALERQNSVVSNSQVERMESETKMVLAIEKGMIVKEETYQTKSYYKNSEEAMESIKDSIQNHMDQIKSQQFSSQSTQDTQMINNLLESQRILTKLEQHRKSTESDIEEKCAEVSNQVEDQQLFTILKTQSFDVNKDKKEESIIIQVPPKQTKTTVSLYNDNNSILKRVPNSFPSIQRCALPAPFIQTQPNTHQNNLQEILQKQPTINKFLENGRFKSKFETQSILGKGGFGTVYKVKYLLDNNLYALKKVKLHLGVSDTLQDHKVYREIQAITRLEPRNILRYYTCWIEALENEELDKEQKLVDRFKSKRNIKDIKQKFQQNQKQNRIKEKSNDSYSCIESDDEQSIRKYVAQKDYFESSKGQVQVIKHSIDSDVFNQSRTHQSQIDQQSDSDSEDEDSDSDNEESSYLDSESGQEHSYEGGTVSIYTIRQFVKKDRPYVSLNLMIQTEYCSGQTLRDSLHKRGKTIDRNFNYQIFSQIINGVITIHEANIIHRDLKPENIFLDENQNIKIGDFGLAREFQPLIPTQPLSSKDKRNIEESGQVGTPLYLSPEQINYPTKSSDGQIIELDGKVDIYSLGLILLELSTSITTTHEKLSSFTDVKEKRKFHNSSNLLGTIEGDLILLLTQVNPNHRPSAIEIKDQWLPKWQQEL